MQDFNRWIWCGIAFLFGVIALFVSARGGPEQPVAYYGGLLFFAFTVGFVLYLIKLHFDHAKRPH
ncbi:MAG TPA: hypothetical protein VFZ07_08405 [Dongiaceae bacterium]